LYVSPPPCSAAPRSSSKACFGGGRSRSSCSPPGSSARCCSGDITLRAFAGHRLFPYAAPSGGMILIAARVGLVAAAVVGAASRG